MTEKQSSLKYPIIIWLLVFLMTMAGWIYVAVQELIPNPAPHQQNKPLERKLEICSVEPLHGSIEGGTDIKFKGNFSLAIGRRLEVEIGEVPCDITRKEEAYMTCRTNPNNQSLNSIIMKLDGKVYPLANLPKFNYSTDHTPVIMSVTPTFVNPGQRITLQGSGFSDLYTNLTVYTTLTQLSTCNIISCNTSTIICVLSSHQAGRVDMNVHVKGKGFAINLVNNIQLPLLVHSISPKTGSYGGRQKVIISGQGFSERALVIMGGKKCEIISYTPSQLTCYTPSRAHHNTNVTATAVVVSVTTPKSSSSSISYEYRLNETAIVDSVSPNDGGTGGGTSVRIVGKRFNGFSFYDPIVMIGEVPCSVRKFNDTYIQCVTAASVNGSILSQVDVHVGNLGSSSCQQNCHFHYIDRWSSEFTWMNRSLPSVSDIVLIPKGKTVLLDTETEVLKLLVIDGGKLIFEDKKNVSLHAESIFILDGGLLQIGSEESSYESNTEIVLYDGGSLHVSGASLHLHGRHIPFTWTRLNQTATKGSTQVTLQHSVGWRINDEVVIASTAFNHEENEQRKIIAISSDGKTLTLNEALQFEHVGFTETFGGRTLEFRAEVALLTRNVVVRGSNHFNHHILVDNCEETSQTCFNERSMRGGKFAGASIRLRTKGNIKTNARMEYVEMTFMGSSLKRYPLHYYLMGSVAGMYIRGSSIHNTFNGAVSIQGTNNLTVDQNVIYDVIGDGFRLEDGTEVGNMIRYNLAIQVTQNIHSKIVDVTPASFSIANPNNHILHNHAVGGSHYGFWYRLSARNQPLCSHTTELGAFTNNTAHSHGQVGLLISPVYRPVVGGRCRGKTPSPALFQSLKSWRNNKGAEWRECGSCQLHNFTISDNILAGIDMKLVVGQLALIKGGLVVGRSSLSTRGTSFGDKQFAIMLPFSPGLSIEDVDFHNFDHRGVVFGLTNVDGICSNFSGGFYYTMKGLSFTNVTKRITWRWEHEGVIDDTDGTVTGKYPHLIAPFSGLLNSPDCQIVEGELFSSGQVKSVICPHHVRMHRFILNNIAPSKLVTRDMVVSNPYGTSIIPYGAKHLTHQRGWMVLLLSNETHMIGWKDEVEVDNIYYDFKIYDLLPKDYVLIEHQLTSTPQIVGVGDKEDGGIINTRPLVIQSSENFQWSFNPNTNILQYIIAARGRLLSTYIHKRGDVYDIDESAWTFHCRSADCQKDIEKKVEREKRNAKPEKRKKRLVIDDEEIEREDDKILYVTADNHMQIVDPVTGESKKAFNISKIYPTDYEDQCELFVKIGVEEGKLSETSYQLQGEVFRTFVLSDMDRDERLNVSEAVKFLRKLYMAGDRNVYDLLTDEDLLGKDREQNGYLLYRDLQSFANKKATVREDRTWEIFNPFTLCVGLGSKNPKYHHHVMLNNSLRDFMNDVQKEDVSIDEAQKLIKQFHKTEKRAIDLRSQHFENILISHHADPVDKKHKKVFQNMTYPLTDYYIFTSHNTYLTGRQQDGPVGAWNYRKALELGVRVLQIDIMDTWKGLPKVTQYDSLTGALALDDVLFTISKYAFKTSNYPLILDIKNYCNVKQTEYFYNRIREVFGSYIVERSIDGKMDELPSPYELRNKIILKGDAGPFTVYMKNRELIDLSDSTTFSELFAIAYQESRAIDSSTISDAKAAILRYANSRGFGTHTAFQMLKVTPSKWRLASNNFDPIPYWNLGVHMNAANIQYEDWPLYSHITFFRGNGNCGYILKPRFLEFQGFDPLTDERNRMYSTPIQLRIEVFYGVLLPNKGSNFNRRIDPFVRISIYGLPVDTKYLETLPVENSGFNPDWADSTPKDKENKMEFNIDYPELAWLLIELVDAGHGDTDWEHIEAVYSLPVLNLAQGYRYVHLEDYGGFKTGSAAILIFVSFDSTAKYRVQPNEAKRLNYKIDQFANLDAKREKALARYREAMIID